MSVSKSLLGLVAGAMKLEVERQVTSLVPELKGTAYEGATIRHLLDMRAGVAFNEDYLATSGPIVEYRKATGWNPPQRSAGRSAVFLYKAESKAMVRTGAASTTSRPTPIFSAG